jgi:heat shock protein HslJ
MKHTSMPKAALIVTLVMLAALLAACSGNLPRLPALPGEPATKAPSPMPPAGKMTVVPTKAPAGPSVAAKAVVTATAPMTATAPIAGSIAATTTVSLEGTPWKMVSYLDSKGQTIQALPGSEVTAMFQDGKVAGKDGCNQYAGTYKVTGNVLTVKLGPSTLMACDPKIMDQAQGYAAALSSSATYQITGKQLQITNGGGKVAVTYAVLESTPLAGTTWQATSYNNGKGGAQSIATGTEITAIFGADGTLSGSGGCNNYSTAYQVITNTIKISPAIATTRMMCPEPVMQQETAYLTALPTAAVYRIESNKLELRDAKGALVASYVAKVLPAAAGQAPAAGAGQAPSKTVTTTVVTTATLTLPLEGTPWKLASLLSTKGGAFPPLPGTEITALFQGGKVTGSAGCNNYSAAYKASGDKLTITTPAATTRMACPAPTMQQETAYLAALGSVTNYKINGDKLELRNAAGNLVASYIAPVPAAAAPIVPAPAKPVTPTLAPAAPVVPAPAKPVTPTVAPAPAAPAAKDQLTNTLWKWVRFVSPVEAVDIANSDKYTVVFQTDGKVNITADCNKVSGTYKTIGSRIQIQLGPSTMAACPPGSLSDQFLVGLRGAALYFMEDGNLYIEIFADSGVMKFASGGPAK